MIRGLAALLPLVVPHPGPPVWGDLTIGDSEVVFALQGEPEPLRTCLQAGNAQGARAISQRGGFHGTLAETV